MAATTLRRRSSRICVSDLDPGDYRRVPDDSTRPAVGYYVSCPSCGMTNVVLASENDADDADEKLTIKKPFACIRCKREMVAQCGVVFDA